MKYITIILALILVGAVYGSEFGDRHWSGTITSTQSTGTNTYCQKHIFYKSGLIVNITFPFDLPAGGTYRFFVTNSLVTGNVYGGVDRTYTGNDLRKTTSLGAYNFSVTAGQVLYFCIDYVSGSFGLMERGVYEIPAELTSRYYGNDQSVNVGQDYGIWNGSSFPLTTRLTFFNQTLIDPAIGGGYIYDDGTGNLFASAGRDIKISTLDTGEEFYYDDDTQKLASISMILKDGAGTGKGIKMGVKLGGTDIANCTFNDSEIQSYYRLITCDVSGYNATITNGQNYTVYASCYTNTSYSTRCDGTTRYIYTATSMTPDGFSVGQHIAWASWDTDRSHYTATFYEDVPFVLNAEEFVQTATQCTTWELPYYFKEHFNGYMGDCGWIVNVDQYNDGVLAVDGLSLYTAEKYTDLAKDSNTRYVTLTYDLQVIDVGLGSTITVRLYDSSNFNFLTVYNRDSGQDLWYNEGGLGKVAYSNITLNETFEYMYVIDFQEDTYDIYFNGSKVVTGSQFANVFNNLKDINYIKIASNSASYELDNVKLFASDSNGVPLLPDTDLIPTIPNGSVKVCGLFYDIDQVCTDDSDCITGECLANGKCSSFDFNYCDTNGKSRGNLCIFSGVASCTFTSIGDIIFGNFLSFLMLLLVLMIVVYLVIMFRRRGG